MFQRSKMIKQIVQNLALSGNHTVETCHTKTRNEACLQNLASPSNCHEITSATHFFIIQT
jgi:hypothetical protein